MCNYQYGNMGYNIDLKELSARESEKVEWKENGDDKDVVRSIVKTISAFANDIANVGGGYVVCGAKETKDAFGFPKVVYTGLSAVKLKEIEGKVLAHCRDHVSPSLSPLVQEMDNPENKSTKILIFIVMASPHAHTYRDGETSNYYVRTGKETRAAKNGILTQLLTGKQEIIPFDKRANPNVNETDIDIFLFRDCMNEMKLLQTSKPLEEYFSDKEQIAEFVPPLLAKRSIDNTCCLRNFALFLFGKKASITRNFPYAYTALSIYHGVDRSEPAAARYELTGSIVEQAKRAIELLNMQAYTAFDKTSDKPNQVKYPVRALQESLINAIAHRDYEIHDPIRITVFSDRIEIISPGSLHWGVDKEKFLAGKASARWRNQSFAYLFNKLQLAQSEGQGIPTIIRTMKEEGCPAPIFEIGTESLTCILPAHPRHQLLSGSWEK
jgi:predicted HTH transcriptional regulator